MEISAQDHAKLQLLLSLVNEDSQPNLNALNIVARDVKLINLNIKAMGYELARQMAQALPVRTGTAARAVGLASKLSTQADLETDWAAHWCAELKIPVLFHRKVWEHAFALQAFHDHGVLRPGARGLGFGCGVEPIPSYLAARGVSVTITDLESERAAEKGWAHTNQHTAGLDQAHHPHLVDRATFDKLVDLRYVDMNAIPDDLSGYDFCWSICAFEHLGSIAQGLDFVENALATLKPGGVAIHTTEFNIDPDGPTIDNWPTVLFQRRHFEELAARLAAKGHKVAPFDFDPGSKPMDRFVDLPPFAHDTSDYINRWLGNPAHMKVGVDGFVSTCFGLIVQKAG